MSSAVLLRITIFGAGMCSPPFLLAAEVQMDAAAVILLMVEAVMALLLLYFDGLLKSPCRC